jgi:hypothetical protein
MAFSAGQVLTAAQLNDFAPGTRVQIPDGTVSAAALANTGDLGTGIYYPATSDLSFTVAGTKTASVIPQGLAVVDGSLGAPSLANLGDLDTGLWFSGADQISLSCGGVESLQINTFEVEAAFPIRGAAGSLAAPSFSFSTEINTGMYRGGAGQIAFSCSGVESLHINTFQVEAKFPIRGANGSAALPSFSFANDSNTGMYWVTDDQLGFAAGGTESFRIVDSGATQEIFPGVNNAFLLGTDTREWQEVWATDTTINTSDMRYKTVLGPSLGLGFIRDLDAFRGSWSTAGDHVLENPDGVTEHQWLSAQNVAAALESHGLDPALSGMWREGSDGRQHLGYAELIPVLVAAVQELADKVDAL